MKRLRICALALMALGLLVPCVLMPWMPAVVPVHYGVTGAADRFGSPWMYLLLPVISAALGAALLLAAPRQKGGPGQLVMTRMAVYLPLFFCAINSLLMWKARGYDPAAGAAGWNVGKLITVCIAALLLLMGNMLPKARRNASFGLRNRWSRHSDGVWRRCQRAGGYLMVGIGLLLLAAAVLLNGLALFITLLALLAGMAAGGELACYLVYRAEVKRSGL